MCKQRLFNVIEPFRYVCVFSVLDGGGGKGDCGGQGGRGLIISTQPIRSRCDSGKQEAQMTNMLEKPFIIFLTSYWGPGGCGGV